jgi:hypothetical protein
LFDSFILPHDLFTQSGDVDYMDERREESGGNIHDEAIPSDKSSQKDSYKMFEDWSNHFNQNQFYILPPLMQLSDESCNAESSQNQRIRMNMQSLHAPNTTKYLKTLAASSMISNSSWKQSAIANSSYPQQPTWFPAVDEFVRSCRFNTQGGVVGSLHSWSLFKQMHCDFIVYKVRYQIMLNRYCERIKRMHKSNGIYLEVNLMSHEIIQKCWDIDCRGFSSQPILIPDDCIPSVEEILLMVAEYEFNHQSTF